MRRHIRKERMHRIVSAQHPGIESRPSSDGELNQLPPRHQQLAERQIEQAERRMDLPKGHPLRSPNFPNGRATIGGSGLIGERELQERWNETFHQGA